MARDAAGGGGGAATGKQLGGGALLRGQQPPLASVKTRLAEDQAHSALEDAVAAALGGEEALTAQAGTLYQERTTVDGYLLASRETKCRLVHLGPLGCGNHARFTGDSTSEDANP